MLKNLCITTKAWNFKIDRKEKWTLTGNQVEEVVYYGGATWIVLTRYNCIKSETKLSYSNGKNNANCFLPLQKT
jgi:hypothetical protein